MMKHKKNLPYNPEKNSPVQITQELSCPDHAGILLLSQISCSQFCTKLST
jgi:hypothetical protein